MEQCTQGAVHDIFGRKTLFSDEWRAILRKQFQKWKGEGGKKFSYSAGGGRGETFFRLSILHSPPSPLPPPQHTHTHPGHKQWMLPVKRSWRWRTHHCPNNEGDRELIRQSTQSADFLGWGRSLSTYCENGQYAFMNVGPWWSKACESLSNLLDHYLHLSQYNYYWVLCSFTHPRGPRSPPKSDQFFNVPPWTPP